MKLLREYIRQILKEDDFVTGRPKWIKFFHISKKDLGKEFTFTPRLPSTPAKNGSEIIEDTITLRTSWATTIVDALEALNFDFGDGVIYGVKNLPGDVDLENEFEKRAPKVSKPEGNWYDIGWDRKKYRKETGKDQDEVDQDLKKLVPDAPETHEHWATKTVTAHRVGRIEYQKGEGLIAVWEV